MFADSGRHGFSLLEILVALMVMGLAGVSLVQLTAQGLRSTQLALELEASIADQDRLLSAYTLLNRRDLQSRVGSRSVGPYTVRVTRLDWGVYRVAIGTDSDVPDLVTVVHRPDRDRE